MEWEEPYQQCCYIGYPPSLSVVLQITMDAPRGSMVLDRKSQPHYFNHIMGRLVEAEPHVFFTSSLAESRTDGHELHLSVVTKPVSIKRQDQSVERDLDVGYRPNFGKKHAKTPV